VPFDAARLRLITLQGRTFKRIGQESIN